MQSFAGTAASPALAAPGPNQRVHYRHPIHSLVYVILDEGNGGIIRNISQSGAAIQAVGALRLGQTVRMRFDLLNPRSRIDVQAVVSWANPSGQAGVRFLQMSRQACRQLNDWIFANLMRGFEQISPVFPLPADADELILSASARPAIRVGLAPPRAAVIPQARAISLPWWPLPMTSGTLAKVMDGLILLSASLMFFCAFMAVAGVLPAWPLALLVGVGVCGFFTSLYLYLGAWLGCGTLGAQLARMAMHESDRDCGDQRVRFR
ncbi:MAG TPA: PilZ domain-containing protein [Terriglobales bacterium]|nr:PilZ domain-containing protein [Terriglobales bacterium]